jgi:hypothetical protein
VVESAVVADPEPLHDTANSGNSIVTSFNVKFLFIENRNRGNAVFRTPKLKKGFRAMQLLCIEGSEMK